MSTPYERIVAEDLALGAGTVQVTMPGGGSATGHQIGLHTFGLPIFNVLDYGAIGNGIADDSTAISNALAAAVAAGGGEIYFPPGTYRATQVFNVTTSNIRLTGAGRFASVILWDDLAVDGFVFTGGSPLASTLLTADGNHGDRAITVASATGAVVGNWCYIQDATVPSLEGNGSFSSRVFNVSGTTISLEELLPLNFPVLQTPTAFFYAATAFLSGIYIADLGFGCSAANAVNKLHFLTFFRCVSPIVERCRFDNCVAPCITTVGCHDANFVNNSLERSTTVAGCGIEIQTSTNTRIALNTTRRCRFGYTVTNSPRSSIVGNIVSGREPLSGNSGRGIRVSGMSTHSVVVGNTVNDTGFYGIYLDASSWCAATGNNVTNVGEDALEHGIQSSISSSYPTYGQYNVISGNTVSFCTGNGIIIGNGDGFVNYPNYSVINGNVISDCVNGAILLRGSYCTVSGNHCSSPDNSPADIEGGTASTNNAIIGNHITRPGATGSSLFYAIRTNGTDGYNRIQGNKVSPDSVVIASVTYKIPKVVAHALDVTDATLAAAGLPLAPIFTHTPVATGANTNETTAWAPVIPGGTMYQAGQGFHLRANFLIASDTHSKTLKVKLGDAVFTGVADVPSTAYRVTVDLEVQWTGSAAATCWCNFWATAVDNLGFMPGGTAFSANLDWTVDQTITLTMTNGAATANEISFTAGKLTFEGIPTVPNWPTDNP
jgi:parallel beta-helix repeat protein